MKRFLRVTIFRERFRKPFRQTMGVDENLLDADVDQMIERKGDQRFLENRDEWFRQFFGKRSQSGSEPGAEDECLCDLCHQSAALTFIAAHAISK